MLENKNINTYAYLPEDLLLKILEKTPDTAEKLSQMINNSDESLIKGREELNKHNIIKTIKTVEYTDSLIAVDGANIVEKMTGSDLLMAIAVGVEGLTNNPAKQWSENSEQYYQWQDALPHHVANSRLCQGIMFLMELSILAKSHHEIRIMDGSHITSILKLNSLLSANAEALADEKYVESLNTFLSENYQKIIPDIPDIIDKAFKNSNIIGLAKYSSSRDILDSIYLKNVQKEFNIAGDDKTYFSLLLNEDEYTQPLEVGQSEKEKTQWNIIHIKCNLNLKNIKNTNNNEKVDIDKLNKDLKKSISRFRPSRKEGTDLYFCYYKPFKEGLCYRIEMKKALAKDIQRLEKYLLSIKNQIFYPEIHEPYPQYLADIIAKNISLGMDAVKQAVTSHEKLNTKENFHLSLSYRSN
ncbi:hypothetical protein CRV03_07205 [Arcobacter sp. F155]|uniref:DNA double-strand break repair nuclease NurA n=1 Tax=Arcobacter sp. F155 TaxID=2044512 RepID=UPI00100B29ED|nr:DNA double-strand break repair nuclease NurA [Arcobacter sp. F155]RXJ77043.1 hypothetical protein CRV03_07205 [Arcobacter sp. F155]